MSDALKILFPNKIQSDYFILKSVGGCKPQRLHCDYAPTDSIMKCEDQEVPLVCLTSISDACSVLVCENSIRYTSTVGNVKQVWLKRGDLMVFRGDLVHAGSGYTSDNYRMHCYLDSIKVKREPNKTWKL